MEFYLCQDELRNLAKSERMAINISNVANMFLFVAKVYASIESRSLAVIASTMDSLLDLLSGFILWFTSQAMRKPNRYRYPVGKQRMQPVVSQTALAGALFSVLSLNLSYFPHRIVFIAFNISNEEQLPTGHCCVCFCDGYSRITSNSRIWPAACF